MNMKLSEAKQTIPPQQQNVQPGIENEMIPIRRQLTLIIKAQINY
jgi:hypothetical protein